MEQSPRPAVSNCDQKDTILTVHSTVLTRESSGKLVRLLISVLSVRSSVEESCLQFWNVTDWTNRFAKESSPKVTLSEKLTLRNIQW